MTKSFMIAVVAGVAVLSGSPVAAHDWPQWRGPTRDGVVAAEGVPDRWPQSLHAAWTVETGKGYGSPWWQTVVLSPSAARILAKWSRQSTCRPGR